MSIGPESPIDREPLTPEERELAQRLSRLGHSAGPSSAIDARILAAAREAVARTPPRMPRTPRWPIALGAVASLALAVGIAWRLRPLPEPPQAQGEAASARAVTLSAPATAVQTPGAAPVADQGTTQQAPPSATTGGADAAATQAAAEATSERESAAPPMEPPIVVDEARASDMAARQPAPPPPPAPAAATAAHDAAPVLDAAAPAAQERKRSEAFEAADAAQRAKSASAQRQPAAEAALSRRESQPVEDIAIEDADDSGDEPPAYANSPLVREAWLQRVRELIAEGDVQHAHDSLHEFQRRYPDHPLPDDLKRFQQTKHDTAVP